MPLGYERLNERSQRPNTLINFIKPIEGPDKATAEDFLNRIAAQCYPVMKAAHISVMSLEEFPHNNEFLGRNFNAGECIQLVLKDRSGRWLGFKFVQMVMMHELAHCKQMDHSKFFWQVRNQYAQEMYDLWAKNYLGEGVWGRGQHLTSGGFVMDRPMADGDVPEHLCGGTYRRRGRKRKRNAGRAPDDPRPTYAERQQRRIAKKFGKHGGGNALGEDELVRGALEQSHRHQGKPRVANSKRGRELNTSSTSTVRGCEDTAEDDNSPAADSNGYVKVCNGEDEETEDANDEMKELRAVTEAVSAAAQAKPSKNESSPKAPIEGPVSAETAALKPVKPLVGSAIDESSPPTITATAPVDPTSDARVSKESCGISVANTALCPICSLENESATCKESEYLNAGDAGRCGICGSAKPMTASIPARAVGPISADVLRWD
ncbi:hypothetical protein AMS68_006252 [Peltaster fructicola]|uniref:WLM domain-containing protein n=1 Tax=Peltaster fructicola TaxID=286661 RepID=A0A6H0Y1E9_9PEZI|nr:hypothetical protein AMS68_006252 [Peltaster fructicola]